MDKQTKTILILAGVGVAAYFLLRPKQPYISTLPGAGYYPYAPSGTQLGYPQTGTTAQTVTAAGSALTSLANSLGNLFKKDAPLPTTQTTYPAAGPGYYTI